MRELPILMATDPVRAILAGRKTQDRRPMKPQPPEEPLSESHKKWGNVDGRHYYCGIKSPYQVGDLLYVRETWCLVNDTDYGGELWVDYRATSRYDESRPAGWQKAPDDLGSFPWRLAIHMPKWATRLWLEVVKVRVERLQEITVEGIITEGLQSHFREHDAVIDLRTQFARLWNSIYGKKYPWESNPWVWVYDFKVAE